MHKKIAIITGATGGIGKEFTRLLIKEHLDEIWIIARNQEKLDLLKNEYGERIVPISKDLTNTKDLCEIGKLLEDTKPIVQYLINNASLAKMGSYKEFTVEEIENTINVNCKAPVILSNLCIPYMEKGSCILNISSASAFQPNPYINLYAASKAFERSYSRALNVEVAPLGITVTAVCPSWVDTDMLTKTINGHKVRFPGMVTAKKVAEKAIKDTKKGKDMSICSLYVKCQHINVKLLPHRIVMKIWMNGLRKYL
ncbi:SDR family NAD(P)-dependent oxidoreductase [Anaeromicropila herbilytica]|uniref:Short-chain dehydrogenase n=1 Tax=Anaeromicropila herbilytica TaxID=2785025 RepID=A0A7R7EI67_9FIRM|nr:SDR family NAD(P)-dependent oxidoreductase [Anaeromicropila herbilytica]BCN29165.1 short-chain dehydrogenase [Anaeromicropila herbilytica]